MTQFLKLAGLTGITMSVLFFTYMVTQAIFQFPEPPEEIIAAFLGGGAMGFCGCVVLALNEIAVQLKKRAK